jgi:PAS domain S-box-containing protein
MLPDQIDRSIPVVYRQCLDLSRIRQRMPTPRSLRVDSLRRIRPPATTTGHAYLIAALLVGAAIGFRLALSAWLGDSVPYMQFFPAILVAAWYGGFGPGAVATALSAAAAMALFLAPPGFAVGGTGDVVSLVLFIAIGLGIAGLSHELRGNAALAAGRAERLDAIIDTTVDGIIVIDERGSIEAFNRGAERLFGYPAQEVIGRNVNLLMPSPYHEEHDQYLARYRTGGAARVIGVGREVSGRRRDGTVFPLHLSVGEMSVGGKRMFTGMLHDLTARVRLENQLRSSEARWRAVVNSAVDGIIVIDSHGRVEAFNRAAERLFEYSEAEVIGHNVDRLMPPPYRQEHDGYLSRYLATGRAKIIGLGREVTGRRKDGTTFPLHLSVGEITIDGDRKFTGIVHDLTARVQMEAQLREQASLARLGEMAAVVAHEVKNPLAGIRGAVQILERRQPRGSMEAQVMQEIVARIDALDGMMKDLLLFSRPPVLKRIPTEVVPLVAGTAELLRQDPALQQVEVAVEGTAPPISADAEMLRLVFQNLLLNGAHAMEGRGRIQVNVRVSGTVCQVAITDNGPGIPADIRQKIFTPFFTTKSAGSGLGLPTAKRLVEAHDGEIAIDCPPAGGTTVVVRLPLA